MASGRTNRDLTKNLRKGCIDGALEIIRTDKSYDVNELYESGTPLTFCIAQTQSDDDSHIQVIRELVNHPKIKINMKDRQGETALLVACSFAKSPEAIRILLESKKCFLTIQDKNGQTALHRLIVDSTMVHRNAPAIFNEMAKHPQFLQSVVMRDNLQRTVLDMFLSKELIHAYDMHVKLLPEAKALLDRMLSIRELVSASRFALPLAADFWPPHIFEAVLKSGSDINSCLRYGESTVHCIVEKNSLVKLRMALDRKPDLTKTWNGRTAFELAITLGSKPQIIEALARSLPIHNIHSSIENCTQEKISTEDFVRRLGERSLMEKFKVRQGSSKAPAPTHVFEKWKTIKEHISTKVYVSKNNNNEKSEAVDLVRDSQYLLRNNKTELQQITSAIKNLFSRLSNDMKRDHKKAFLAFSHFLSGSMGDGTRCFAPSEYDVMCVFENTRDLDIDTKSDMGDATVAAPEGVTGWTSIAKESRLLAMRKLSYTFYSTLDKLIQTYVTSHNAGFEMLELSSFSFQYMEKISRLQVYWKGDEFFDMKISIDVVPVFRCRDFKPTIPLPIRVECDGYYAIVKAPRHHYTFEDPDVLPISYCRAEVSIMHSLPDHIRRGIVIAKALRLASVSGPALDLRRMGMAEDLHIEDYVTSHILKTCLLKTLQALRVIDNKTEPRCHFKWADRIYAELEKSLECNKGVASWYDERKFVISCKPALCDGKSFTCCKKRQIILVLTRVIRTWLQENISRLHGSKTCNCPV